MYRLCLLLLLCVSVSFAQRGKEGSKTVSASNVLVNEYTSLTADASVGATNLSVLSSSLNANNRFAAPLAAGDLILIIQMQGVTVNGTPNGIFALPNDSTWGAVLAYNECGNYEFQQVSAVPNGTSIVLDCGLSRNYTAAGKVQIVRVPRYQTLTVNSGGSISCDAWNGQAGGVLSIEVFGATLINGTINASGKGFRGGQTDNNSTFGGLAIGSTADLEGAEKGEGVAGYQTGYNVFGGSFCRGAAANAGGGGNAHNSGGGGGANAGNILNWNGHGNPDNSNANWIQAWNLELAGNAALTSSGGGKGGYSASTNDKNALAVGPFNTQWSGDNRCMMGGLGGRPLDYSTGKLFMGGGGGAGDGDDSYAGKGGAGGGLVYITTFNTISGSGQITANGDDGKDADGTPSPLGLAGQDGAGGAGGGGTIIINTTGSLTGINCQANGGKGGAQHITKGALNFNTITQAQGPGGGGGGGYIAISNGAVARVTTGGTNGVTNSPSLSEFPPNGATQGGAGIDNANVSSFSILALHDTICIGNTATLVAQLNGNVPPGTSLNWYSTSAGGTPFAAGSSISIPNVLNDSTVYVGTCPGSYREPVKAVMSPVYNATLTPDIQICPGDSTMLSATPGYTYSWSPGAGLTNTTGANVIAKPSSTTTYTVSITDAKGCNISKMVTVTVSTKLQVIISNDTSICKGTDAHITISGGNTYSWNNGLGSSPSQTVSPAVTTRYIVSASNGNNCTATDSVTVTVVPLPVPSAGNDTTINMGEGGQLNASGGSTYLWKPSAGLSCVDCPNPIASPTSTTEYTVVVTNSNGCSDTDRVLVTVRANNVVFVPDVFSPNGDGQNDILYIRGNGIKELHFALYDRWGEKIFETRDPLTGWDGTQKGNPLNSAVFVYYAKVTFTNGDKTTLKGDISLVR